MAEWETLLDSFLKESNAIEGIFEVRAEEWEAAHSFLWLDEIRVADLANYVNITARGKLRTDLGMNVWVGIDNYLPPFGGEEVEQELKTLIAAVNEEMTHPWRIHIQYERLHPFTDGNGRSGRLLWAWQMLNENIRPGLSHGFLETYYRQTLQLVR